MVEQTRNSSKSLFSAIFNSGIEAGSVESFPDFFSMACFIVSSEGQVEQVNAALASMLGFKSQDDLLRCYADGIRCFLHVPEGWSALFERLVAAQGEVVRISCILHHADVREIPCIVSARIAVRKDTGRSDVEAVVWNDKDLHRVFAMLTGAVHLRREMLNYVPDSIIIHDRGRVLYANRAAKRFFPVFERTGTKGCLLSELMDIRSSAQILELESSAVTGYARMSGIQPASLNTDATLMDVYSGSIVFEEKTVRIVLFREYSEINSSENDAGEKRDENYELLLSIFENSPFPILLHDEKYILRANPKAAEFFEFSDPDAMVGKRNLDLVSAESRGTVSSWLCNFSDNLEASKAQYSFELAGGGMKYVIGRSVSIMFRNRSAVLSMFQDLTETREHYSRYSNLFDSAPIGIGVEDMEGRFIRANQRMAEMFGYDAPDEMIRDFVEEGRRFFASSKDYVRLRDQVRKNGEAHRYMCRNLRRDGSPFWTALSAVAITGPDGRHMGYKLFVHDVTERRRAEEYAEERGRKIRALSAKLTLALEHERHNIARNLHDGPVQLLALATMMLSNMPEHRECGELNRSLDLLRETARQLRANIADLAPPALFAADLAGGLAGLAGEFQSRHSLAVEVECPDIFNLSRDAASFLYRSVKELLVNAVKHGRARKAFVRVEIWHEKLALVVEDDGRGFDSDRSGEFKPGSMGLPDLRALARDLGGELEVGSRSGVGARVVLVLPLDALSVSEEET